jgi:hypothetical protein
MAEPERTTSFAKSVEGLHHEESALDRARSLRDQFVHAQEQNNEKQREAEKPRDTEKTGSQMVKDDRPVLQPTPRGNMRQTPDRFAAYRKLEREHKKAGTSLEQKARALHENKPAPPTHDRFAAASQPDNAKQNEAVKTEAARKAMENFHARQQQIRDHERDRER